MDTRTENIIIMGAFLVCMTALVMVNVMPARQVSSVRVSQMPPFGATAPPEEAADAGSAADAAEDILEMWGRDPFEYGLDEVTDFGGVMPVLTLTEEEEIPEDETLFVTLILISDEVRTASINGRIYKEGQEVQGEKITEIVERGIWLEKNKKRRFLTLREEGNIKIRVQGNNSGER